MALPYRLISGLLLLLVPLLSAMGLVRGLPVLLWAAAAVLMVGLVVWLAMRPSWFAVDSGHLVIRWPLRERRIPLRDIEEARVVRGTGALLEEVRPGFRVGAGGLFGTFGMLWTRKHGLATVYLTRTDEALFIARRTGRAMLFSPVDAERLAAILQAQGKR
jgi:hypothetical protein